MIDRYPYIKTLLQIQAGRYFEGKPFDEVHQLFEQFLRKQALRNPCTGRPIILEDSPGNFFLVQEGDKIICRVHVLYGPPNEVVVSPDPEAEPDEGPPEE